MWQTDTVIPVVEDGGWKMPICLSLLEMSQKV